MPEVTTPFLLTLRGGEQMHLREKRQEPQSLSFVSALTSVVFTRQRSATTSSVPVTVSLVAQCDAEDTSIGHGNCFTLASHQFDAPGAVSGDKKKEENEAVVVSLRSPIVLTSSGCVHTLEVRCTEVRRGDLARGQLSDATAYSVTMHGMQQTTLTKAQVELLCGSGNDTKQK